MDNFLILGTDEQVTIALTSARSVIVDKDKKPVALHELISTLTKQLYVEVR